jgi:phosphoglycerol transferase MdoB-like AlkP superfamily enzyme
MKSDFLILYIASFITTMIAAYFKSTQSSLTQTFLTLGILAAIAYIYVALNEIWKSNIPRHEKIQWTFGFLLINSIAGLVYLISGRKKVMNSQKNEDEFKF